MQDKFLVQFSLTLSLLVFGSNGVAQTWLGSSARPEGESNQVMSAQDRATISQNSLDQAPVGPDDCEVKFPFQSSVILMLKMVPRFVRNCRFGENECSVR